MLLPKYANSLNDKMGAKGRQLAFEELILIAIFDQ